MANITPINTFDTGFNPEDIDYGYVEEFKTRAARAFEDAQYTSRILGEAQEKIQDRTIDLNSFASDLISNPIEAIEKVGETFTTDTGGYNNPLLSAEEANAKYGYENLSFDEPIRESIAKGRYEFRKRQTERSRALDVFERDNSFGAKSLNLLEELIVGTGSDPATYVTFGLGGAIKQGARAGLLALKNPSVAKILSKLGMAGLAQGRQARYAGAGLYKFGQFLSGETIRNKPLLASFVRGGLGELPTELIAEGLRYEDTVNTGGEYDVGMALGMLALGSGIRTGIDFAGGRIRAKKEGAIDSFREVDIAESGLINQADLAQTNYLIASKIDDVSIPRLEELKTKSINFKIVSNAIDSVDNAIREGKLDFLLDQNAKANFLDNLDGARKITTQFATDFKLLLKDLNVFEEVNANQTTSVDISSRTIKSLDVEIAKKRLELDNTLEVGARDLAQKELDSLLYAKNQILAGDIDLIAGDRLEGLKNVDTFEQFQDIYQNIVRKLKRGKKTGYQDFLTAQGEARNGLLDLFFINRTAGKALNFEEALNLNQNDLRKAFNSLQTVRGIDDSKLFSASKSEIASLYKDLDELEAEGITGREQAQIMEDIDSRVNNIKGDTASELNIIDPEAEVYIDAELRNSPLELDKELSKIEEAIDKDTLRLEQKQEMIQCLINLGATG